MQYTQWIYGMYSPEHDITTIMVDTYDEKHILISSEIVGFYHGEPNDSDTKLFYGKLKCNYDF